MDNSFIYGKNAIIEALESGNREFNRILISNTSRADEKIERIPACQGGEAVSGGGEPEPVTERERLLSHIFKEDYNSCKQRQHQRAS